MFKQLAIIGLFLCAAFWALSFVQHATHKDSTPTQLTSEQDHQRMRDLLQAADAFVRPQPA